MRHKILCIAALAVSGVASAQSSVTVFGVADATIMFGRGSVADKTQLGGNGYSSSRLGFRGTEDLGGGMYAKFWLEAGYNVDNGTGAGTNTNNQASGSGAGVAGGQGLTFNRQSWVSLSGTWGEVRVGRQYTPVYSNTWPGDPFYGNGVGTAVYTAAGADYNTVTGVRASNMINYISPNMGGFKAEIAYWLGENAHGGSATDRDGNGWSTQAKYASGPIDLGVAYGRTNYASGDVVQSNLYGTYNFGAVTLFAGYERNKIASVSEAGWGLGAAAPMAGGELRGSFTVHKTRAGTEPKQQQIAIGYVHHLSKRTQLYITYAHVKNSGGSTFALNDAVGGANANSNGLDIGVKHSF